MAQIYVIKNQFGHYWGKAKRWVDGSDPKTVLRSEHHDEAVNALFELSSKDFDLRGEVLAAPLSDRGEPVLEVSEVPLPPQPGDPLLESESSDSNDDRTGATPGTVQTGP